MSPENATVADFRAIEVNTPALSIIQDSIVNAGDTMIEISLLSLLFGILTVLSFTSTYFLGRQGSLVTWTNVKILLVLSNVLIYMSTGIHVAALIWNRLRAKELVSGAMDGLFSPAYDGRREMAVFEDGMRQQLAMAVFALEVNWIIGDAIVWWRACVIWRNRAVYWIGPLLLTLTLGLSPPLPLPAPFAVLASGAVRTTGLALLEIYNPFLAAFAVMSLATNILATSLIAYKAWEHRRVVHKYFSEAGGKSQVLKALALLIESGSVYCALMLFIITYYFRDKLEPSPAATIDASGGLVFAKVGTYFVYGCIGPLVAIYPTFIVFLVALKQSPIDNGALSHIYQTPGGAGTGTGPGSDRVGQSATRSTIVFDHHRSTFRSSESVGGVSAEGDMEGGMEEIRVPAGDWRSMRARSRSRASSMSSEAHRDVKVVGAGLTLV